MIRSAGLVRQAPLAGTVAAARRPVARVPSAVAPPRCSADTPTPKPKSTRGRKKAAAPKDEIAVTVTVTANGPLDEAALLKLSKAELQALAEAKGVPKSGTKAQIVARILGNTESAAAAAGDAATAAPAPKKPRAPRKKPAAKNEEVTVETVAISKPRAVEDPARRQAVLEGQAAALVAATAMVDALNCKSRVLKGQQEALDVAIKVSAALNAKRRVVEGQQRAIAAAVASAAAANARFRVLQGQREALAAATVAAAASNRRHQKAALMGRQQEALRAAQHAAQTARPAAAADAAAAAEPALTPPGFRRKLSPAEATRVLEEIVRRKGAVDAAAAPALTEVERAREVMASLRADLEEQERRTQQLQAVISRGTASVQLTMRRTTSEAAAVEAEDGEPKPSSSGSTSGSNKTSQTSNSPAMEFLGAALVAMGRAITLALSSGSKPPRS